MRLSYGRSSVFATLILVGYTKEMYLVGSANNKDMIEMEGLLAGGFSLQSGRPATSFLGRNASDIARNGLAGCRIDTTAALAVPSQVAASRCCMILRT